MKKDIKFLVSPPRAGKNQVSCLYLLQSCQLSMHEWWTREPSFSLLFKSAPLSAIQGPHACDAL